MLINTKKLQILSEQSGTVAGNDIELDQFAYGETAQDQFGQMKLYKTKVLAIQMVKVHML